MPQPLLVYLDTQQRKYLDDGRRSDRPGLDPAVFHAATRTGRLQIVASLDLLEELMNAIRSRPEFVRRVIPQVLTLAGLRVLRPIHDRLQLAEVKQGGMLPVRKRYLAASERQGLHEIEVNEAALRAIADDSRQRKTEFKDSEEAVRALVTTKLTEAEASPKPGNLLDWHESHDREEWIRSIVEGGQRRGLYEVPDIASWGYRQVPSVHTFVSYQQPRIVHTVGEGRKIQPSDLDDAHHAAAGPYYDVLVTDDRAFGQALDLMPDLSFRWMTSAEFAATHLGG